MVNLPNRGTYALEEAVERASMNSTITLTDTEEEVIDLDSSQDAAADARDDGSTECNVEAKEPPSENDRLAEENAPEDSEPSRRDNRDFERSAEPLFKVMFRDENVARQYRERIKVFVESLASLKCRQKEGRDVSSLVLEVWEEASVCNDHPTDASTESEDSQGLICDSLFTVDTQPKLLDSLDVPTYGKKYEEAFENPGTGEKKRMAGDSPSTMTCFNCMGNHSLRDCTAPRNQAIINKNRKEFNAKGNSRVQRYHLGDDQRFGHMVPGQLSKNLREALGMKDNELPKHIYRMRTLGYPPGWLEEARLQHSGLTLFNSDGVAVADPNDEPGEIVQDGDRDQYDIKKIFDFPGFNVPAPPGTHDGQKRKWAPLLQHQHSKETMLLTLRGKKTDDGYKRKKMKLTGAASSDAEVTPSEMDIEDTDTNNDVSTMETESVNGLFVPPLPKEAPSKPPEPPPPGVLSEDSDCQSQELQSPDSADESASPSSRSNSPSLSDLEGLKKRLLVELDDSSSQSNPDASAKSSKANANSKTDMPPPSANVSLDTSFSENVCGTPNTSRGSIKSVDLGTPILQSASPYNSLPSSDKFSKNICDVINFENLPDSTGKYEQMTGVLQKVRNALAKIHKE